MSLNIYLMFRKLTLLAISFLAVISVATAQHLPEPMSPPRLVNDFAGLLTPTQREVLEHKLVEFDKATSTQIAVVTVADLEGYDVSDYAIRLHEKWGVGSKGKDNGILILVKPRTDTPGGVFISVGYGLGGVVPDIAVSRILDNEMVPAFQQGDFYKGIDNAADLLIKLSSGEFTADEYTDDSAAMWSVLIAMLVFVTLIVILAAKNKGGGGGSGGSSGGRGGGFFPPIILGGGGSGGFGGGGGGGFGGFGGGFTGGGGGGRSF